MLKLYALLSNLIEPITPCYVDHYPELEAKAYPYAEIRFPNVLPNNTFSDNNLLEVDIWDDKATDIREIEGIADAINTAMNRQNINTTDFNVSIFKNTPYRLKLEDPIIHIQRRQLRYVVKTYRK